MRKVAAVRQRKRGGSHVASWTAAVEQKSSKACFRAPGGGREAEAEADAGAAERRTLRCRLREANKFTCIILGV